MNTPTPVKIRYRRSGLIGSPGNYSIDLSKETDDDAITQTKVIGEISFGRLPAEIEKEADFILLAVNNHDKLVEALELALLRCPVCAGIGWYAKSVGLHGEAEQTQCECFLARSVLKEVEEQRKGISGQDR